MKKFIIGLILGLCVGYLAKEIYWKYQISTSPTSSKTWDIDAALVVLKEGEKLLFTNDLHQANEDEPEYPILTYIKNDKSWESHTIPIDYELGSEEFRLFTNYERTHLFFSVISRNENFQWDLESNKFERVENLPQIDYPHVIYERKP